MTDLKPLPDVLVTNIHRRFTGVSATVAALIPLQQKERDVAVIDTGSLGLPSTWPLWKVVRQGWSHPKNGNT